MLSIPTETTQPAVLGGPWSLSVEARQEVTMCRGADRLWECVPSAMVEMGAAYRMYELPQ